MACLTHLGAQRSGSRGGSPEGTHVMSGVEQKILESNPLLEAFGNAKTLRNNNSSRFGKYVEIFFDAVTGAVTGAAVRTYLLERSRVVAVNNPERSFHIFYQLVYGASAEDRAAWRLPKSAAGFDYLARSKCYELPGQSNAEEYEHTRRAMSHIGLSEEQQRAVLRTVAAVLHLGNVAFVEGSEEGAAVDSGAKAQQALQAAAELLGVEPAALAEALTTRQIQTPEGAITTPLSAQAAADSRDSLAKSVYSRLFDWLVAAVNTAVDEAHNCDGGAASAANGAGRRHLSIGLLDIYGFESFEINDLEQLCINLTNEKLQQHFNTHVFKWEQAEYEREGVDWSYISFRDNADVLELLEGKLGVMDLLDEACRFPKATAEDLANKYGSGSALGASSRFARLKRPANAFSIEHYAGSVTYSTSNFLDKNRDYVVAEHQALMSRSSQPLVLELWAPEPAPASGSNGAPNGKGPSQSQFQFRSVSSQCRKQLAELMGALAALQPHYVRCIKPNPANAAGEFAPTYSLQQLRCGGVMEAVRIACAGFAYRRPYASFLDHFWQLCPEPVHALRRRAAERHGPRPPPDASTSSPQESALACLDIAELRPAAEAVLAAAAALTGAAPSALGHMGHTKVFLRSTAATAMERQRVQAANVAATTIQAHYRRLQAERRYQVLRSAVVTIQAHCRGLLARRLAERMRRERAAATIQRGWRSCVQRLRFLRMRRSAVAIQAAWRGLQVRRQLESIRLERAAVVMQTAWRCAAVRREYLGVLRFWRAAVKVQAAWRGYAARQLYREILPLYRAALVCQRVWRAGRYGSVLSNRLRSALLQYWLWSKAAVVVQKWWRGKVARQRYRKLRLQQRRAKLLAAFGGAAAAAGGGPIMRASPDCARRGDARTPSFRPRGYYAGSASKPGAESADSTPGAGAVVTSLLQYWEERQVGSEPSSTGKVPDRRATSASLGSSRPGTADGQRLLGTPKRGLGSTPGTSAPSSPPDAKYPDRAAPWGPRRSSLPPGLGAGGPLLVEDEGEGHLSGDLSCEPSYGQLLDGVGTRASEAGAGEEDGEEGFCSIADAHRHHVAVPA
ncbi:hypothetical protein HYH03_003680 [Edaphochlamys debaryana]|uniref:Myosin motor domain-containing protein n=1 Tax=Edaphochlamys debaryana TaxID=47281 RepID=A0A835Y8V4_9CHLO|nr:hypothetical protein HYH03_003680 [Edaphochlamys debaryana]|eukprot:KAG2498422.1 hypothetical protein HYH03_003680 [Edaphochlamys debaryana]